MATTYPNAVYRPLGTQTEPRMKAHDIICFHTMVGYLVSTDEMFHQNGFTGTESHFGVGGVWGGDKTKGLDGHVWEWQDLDYSADANLEGYWHVISIETADSAPQSSDNLPAWTDNQLDALVDLTVWLCKKYDIPPTLIPDTKPGRRGLAYHAQGVEHSDGVGSHPGWLVKGGERWSTSVGKVCPGAARIRQINTVIIPRVQDILNGDWFSMATEADLKAVVEDRLSNFKFIPNVPVEGGEPTSLMTFRSFAQLSDQKADRANMKQDAATAQIDTLAKTVDRMTTQLAELTATLEDIRNAVVPKDPA